MIKQNLSSEMVFLGNVIEQPTSRTLTIATTHIRIQRDDPHSVVRQTDSQEAAALLSCGYATHAHANDVTFHLLALSVLVELATLKRGLGKGQDVSLR